MKKNLTMELERCQIYTIPPDIQLVNRVVVENHFKYELMPNKV